VCRSNYLFRARILTLGRVDHVCDHVQECVVGALLTREVHLLRILSVKCRLLTKQVGGRLRFGGDLVGKTLVLQACSHVDGVL